MVDRQNEKVEIMNEPEYLTSAGAGVTCSGCNGCYFCAPCVFCGFGYPLALVSMLIGTATYINTVGNSE